MSRNKAKFPWRVIGIALVLFAALAAGVWLVLGSDDEAGVGALLTLGSGDAAAPDGADATPQPTTLPGGTAPDPTVVPSTDNPGEAGTTTAPDPSTVEGRAAMARNRAAAGTMDLKLFLIVPGVERLIPVPRTVAAPPTLDAQVRTAVRELIAWNGTETTSPVAPEARLRETWVSPAGIAYLDFEASFHDISGGGSLGELHAVYGLVATITQSFPEVVAVQFLLEGEEMVTLAGHIDLSLPLTPSDEWVLIEGAERMRQSDDPL